jgi:hypothetical protein
VVDVGGGGAGGGAGGSGGGYGTNCWIAGRAEPSYVASSSLKMSRRHLQDLFVICKRLSFAGMLKMVSGRGAGGG